MNDSGIKLEIQGKIIPTEIVWGHLQDAPDGFDYRLTVSRELESEVFDPHGDCARRTPLECHVRQLISEFGSFVLDGFLARLVSIQAKERGTFEWVIASVDAVERLEEGMVITGKAVPFQPDRAPSFDDMVELK